MKTFILATLIVAAASPVHAFTGNEALKLMVNRDGSPDIPLMMFVQGMLWGGAAARINAGAAARAGATDYLVPFCQPPGSTPEQAAQVVLKELRSNPEHNHYDLGLIAHNSLVKAWPCSEAQLRSQ